MPADPASIALFHTDLQMLSDTAINASLQAFQDDLSAFDLPLGTRGMLNYPLLFVRPPPLLND